MKKSLVVMLLLCGIAVGSIVYGQQKISASSRTVTYEEHVLYGDKSVAEGLHIVSRINGFMVGNEIGETTERPCWTTDYLVQQSPKTDVTFEIRDMIGDFWQSVQGVELEISYYSGTEIDGLPGRYLASDAPALAELENVIDEMAQETKSGDSHTETFDLKEYMDCYPMHISGNGVVYVMSEDGKSFVVGNKELDEKIRSCFSIPLSGEEKLTVTTSKDTSGVWDRLETKIDCAYEINSSFSNVAFPEGCYMAGSVETEYENGKDEGIFRGGIYYLAYEKTDFDDGRSEITDIRDFYEVYPLTERENVIWLKTNQDKTDLILLTEDTERDILRIFDRDTMTLKQELQMPFAHLGNNYLSTITGDDVWVFIKDNENDGSRFQAVRRREDGIYEQVFQEAMDVEMSDAALWTDNTAAFQDGKLVICGGKDRTHDDMARPSTGFRLAVYAASGLLYLGNYDCSLDQGCAYNGMVTYYFAENEPLRLYWE